MWEKEIQSFGHYLRIERGLSGHSHEAYLRDISKLATYLIPLHLAVEDIKENHLLDFLKDLHGLGVEASTQARCLSGIRSFFQFLMFEERISADPTVHIKSPQKGRKLPDRIMVRRGIRPPDRKLKPNPRPKRTADLKGRLLDKAKP